MSRVIEDVWCLRHAFSKPFWSWYRKRLPSRLTLTASAGVVSTCSTRPPATGTRYSSGCAAVGKPRLAAVSCRAAPKITVLSSRSNAYGYSSAEWNVSRRASPPAAGIT